MKAYLLQFVYSLGFGIFIGLVALLKDLFFKRNEFQKENKTNWIFELFLDVILYLFLSLCYVIFAYASCGGVLRWYSLLGSATVSIFIFKLLYKPLETLKNKVLQLLRRIFVFAKIRVVYPVCLLFFKAVKFVFSPAVRILKKVKIFYIKRKIIHIHRFKYTHKKSFFERYLAKNTQKNEISKKQVKILRNNN